MKLVERHIVSRSNKQFKVIDQLAFRSKNLYNSALYTIRKNFEETGKWLRYNELEKVLKPLEAYQELPSQTAQQILMLVDKSLKSYFALLKKFKKNKKALTGCPKFPYYKHKTKGRNIVVFTNQNARLQGTGYINFHKKSGIKPLKTKVDNIQQVRIIPQSSCYVIEVVYNKTELETNPENKKYLSIDLGVNNLATCFDSQNLKGLIVNGRPVKSMNQFYNKKKSKLQSNLEKCCCRKSSKRITQLTFKRNNKIKDYLHKSSRFIVDYCVENGIGNIVVGQNVAWKQEVNLDKKNNQNFVQIPHSQFIDQLIYKAKLVGITVQTTEESYTSKCSALDLEEVKKHENYLGKRIKRGLFQSSNGELINADLNGAINILRKVVGNEILEGFPANRGDVFSPVRLNS